MQPAEQALTPMAKHRRHAWSFHGIIRYHGYVEVTVVLATGVNAMTPGIVRGRRNNHLGRVGTLGPYQGNRLQHLLHVVLLQVLGPIAHRTDTAAPLSHPEQLFQQFITLLIRHYKQEHYIEFYARSLSISPSYLSRIIRQTTHKTAAYFINGLLHAEACRLLRHTDRTIQAIADELNFSDQSAFGKFFKANTGLSPLQYRNRSVKS